MWRYLNRHSLAFSQSRADAEPSHLAIAPAALPDDGSRACRAVADQASRKPQAHVFIWIHGPLVVPGVPKRLFRAWGVRPSSAAFGLHQTDKNFRMLPQHRKAHV